MGNNRGVQKNQTLVESIYQKLIRSSRLEPLRNTSCSPGHCLGKLATLHYISDEANHRTGKILASLSTRQPLILVQSDKILVAPITRINPSQFLNIEERQVLKDFEDSLIDNMLILDVTLDTITALLSTYTQFCRVCETNMCDDHNDDFDLIEAALKDQQRAVSSHRRQIETLHTKVQGTIQLVSIIKHVDILCLLDCASYRAFLTWATVAHSQSLRKKHGRKTPLCEGSPKRIPEMPPLLRF